MGHCPTLGYPSTLLGSIAEKLDTKMTPEHCITFDTIFRKSRYLKINNEA